MGVAGGGVHWHPVAMTMPPLILCAESEPQLLRDISDDLKGAGYRVVEARDGAELLDRLEQVTPDLLLCEITMPGIDGYEVLARFRRDYPHLAHVPLVVLSALSMNEAVIRGKRAGADDCLTKPIEYGMLLSTIEARLRQSRQSRAEIRTLAGLGQHLFDTLAMGMILYAPDGQIRHANPVARKLLRDHGQHLRDLLAEPVRRVGADAQAGIENSLSVLLDENSCLMSQVHACPPDAHTGAGPMVIVFLAGEEARPVLSSDALKAMFDLTATEARVAHLLASGLRPDAIAREMGVAPTTIAFHLRNAFAKTDTHRQAELVALVLSLPLRSEGG